MINSKTKQLINKFIKIKRQHWAYNTARTNRYNLFLFFENNDVSLFNTSTKHVVRFLLQQSIIYTSYTVKCRRTSLHSFFRFYYELGLIKSNPVSAIPEPRTPDKIPSYLSSECATRVVQFLITEKHGLPTFKWLKLKIIVGLALFYGLSLSEMAKLKYSDINLNAKTIRISECYCHHCRDLPLIGPIDLWFEALLSMINVDDYIFDVSKKDPTHFREIHLLNKISAYTGQNISASMLRNTFFSVMYKAGISTKLIQFITGHKGYKSLKSKAHYFTNLKGNI